MHLDHVITFICVGLKVCWPPNKRVKAKFWITEEI